MRTPDASTTCKRQRAVRTRWLYRRAAAVLCVAIAGCSWLEPHKVDVQQGNIIDAAALAELRTGMSKKQVRFLLGNPVINDPFHTHRWDYVYFVVPAGKTPEPQRLTLFFEGNVLTRVQDLYSDQSQGALAPDDEQ